jgi:SAM-dependent methyltransferase
MCSHAADAFRATFHAPGARVTWFSDVVCGSVVSTDAELRVLDIGCGTGDQLFDLAARLPRARLTGVDVSAANITAAGVRCAIHPAGERCTFEQCDYLAFRPAQPFDVLLTHSVLQFVAGGVALVTERIAEDAAPGALFLNVMPYRCPYNDALALMRRALRAVRVPVIDRLVFAAARALHGRSFDELLIAERLEYAYAVPRQFEDDLARTLEARGFQTVRREVAPHASPAQLKHALRIMRRTF